jgi:hypothetical protein
MDPDLAAEIAAVSRAHDLLMARDGEPAVEPIGGPPVRREARGALTYHVRESDALEALPEPPLAAATPSAGETMSPADSENWNRWWDRRAEDEREFLFQSVAEGMSEYVHHHLIERDRKIAEAQAELVEVKGMLTSALAALDEVRKTAYGIVQQRVADKREQQIRDETIRERSARIADLQRDNAASHTELARQQRDRELADRDHRIQLLEVKLDALMRHMSLAGIDLPRGI